VGRSDRRSDVSSCVPASPSKTALRSMPTPCSGTSKKCSSRCSTVRNPSQVGVNRVRDADAGLPADRRQTVELTTNDRIAFLPIHPHNLFHGEAPRKWAEAFRCPPNARMQGKSQAAWPLSRVPVRPPGREVVELHARASGWSCEDHNSWDKRESHDRCCCCRARGKCAHPRTYSRPVGWIKRPRVCG